MECYAQLVSVQLKAIWTHQCNNHHPDQETEHYNTPDTFLILPPIIPYSHPKVNPTRTSFTID